jgi:hypothetical protein
VFLDALTPSASESVPVPVPSDSGLNPVLTPELPLPELLPSRLEPLDALPFSTGPKDLALLAMPPSTLRSTPTEDGKLSLLAAMLTTPNKEDSNKLTPAPFPRLISLDSALLKVTASEFLTEVLTVSTDSAPSLPVDSSSQLDLLDSPSLFSSPTMVTLLTSPGKTASVVATSLPSSGIKATATTANMCSTDLTTLEELAKTQPLFPLETADSTDSTFSAQAPVELPDLRLSKSDSLPSLLLLL